jgi:tryptophan synthase alpha chain
VLDLIREFREFSQTPVVLFTYLNPIYSYGFEKFHHDAAEAGADGILLLDLPPEEAAANAELAGAKGLHHIQLIAPTTPDSRIDQVASKSQGFLYYVCREGVTGEQDRLPEGLSERIQRIQAASTAPTVVGFGISTPSQAATVASHAAGVVVGSAIVRRVEKHRGAPAEVLRREIHDFVKPLVDAVKSA